MKDQEKLAKLRVLVLVFVLYLKTRINCEPEPQTKQPYLTLKWTSQRSTADVRSTYTTQSLAMIGFSQACQALQPAKEIAGNVAMSSSLLTIEL